MIKTSCVDATVDAKVKSAPQRNKDRERERRKKGNGARKRKDRTERTKNNIDKGESQKQR